MNDSLPNPAALKRIFTLANLLRVALLVTCLLLGDMYALEIAKGREVAHRSTCQENLHAIAAAMLMYSQDYDDHLPLVHSTGAGTAWPPQTPSYGWLDSTEPYWGEYVSCVCPSDPYAQDILLAMPPSTHGETSYYFNTNLNARPKNHFRSAIEGLDTEQLSAASKTLLLGEGSDGDARYSRTSTEHQQRSASWFSTDTPDTRHKGGGNYAFCDGHVKFLSPNKISQGLTGSAQPPDITSLSATFAPY